MQALEQIGENRLVGVISHVEEMKATIGQQIIINKMGDGRSNIISVIK
jgi:exonuclease SbcC